MSHLHVVQLFELSLSPNVLRYYLDVHVLVPKLLAAQDLVVYADEVPLELGLLVDENVVVHLVVLGVDREVQAELLYLGELAIVCYLFYLHVVDELVYPLREMLVAQEVLYRLLLRGLWLGLWMARVHLIEVLDKAFIAKVLFLLLL